MSFRILDAASPGDLAAWIALWRRWPAREVQAHPEYVRLFARECDRAVCAVAEEPHRTVLFPLVLRPIAAEPWAAGGERRIDATTPYGYGGPYAWGAPSDDAAFWRAYSGFCRDEGVVSTFARLSLFDEQLALGHLPGAVEVRAPNVVVPLPPEADALWRGYDTRVRKWVQHATRAGVTVEIDRDGARLDAFLSLYTHTMQRNGADAWYFFPRAFFERILERLRGSYAFFHALHEGRVVSSDLVLCSEEHVYYFLGGTLADAFPLGPNYLVKHSVASWAVAERKRGYVLGGGYAPGDGLFRYKRGYARHGQVPFKVACLVHDERSMRELEARREAFAAVSGEAWSPRPGFFPPYRSASGAPAGASPRPDVPVRMEDDIGAAGANS